MESPFDIFSKEVREQIYKTVEYDTKKSVVLKPSQEGTYSSPDVLKITPAQLERYNHERQIERDLLELANGREVADRRLLGIFNSALAASQDNDEEEFNRVNQDFVLYLRRQGILEENVIMRFLRDLLYALRVFLGRRSEQITFEIPSSPEKESLILPEDVDHPQVSPVTKATPAKQQPEASAAKQDSIPVAKPASTSLQPAKKPAVAAAKPDHVPEATPVGPQPASSETPAVPQVAKPIPSPQPAKKPGPPIGLSQTVPPALTPFPPSSQIPTLPQNSPFLNSSGALPNVCQERFIAYDSHLVKKHIVKFEEQDSTHFLITLSNGKKVAVNFDTDSCIHDRTKDPRNCVTNCALNDSLDLGGGNAAAIKKGDGPECQKDLNCLKKSLTARKVDCNDGKTEIVKEGHIPNGGAVFTSCHGLIDNGYKGIVHFNFPKHGTATQNAAAYGNVIDLANLNKAQVVDMCCGGVGIFGVDAFISAKAFTDAVLMRLASAEENGIEIAIEEIQMNTFHNTEHLEIFSNTFCNAYLEFNQTISKTPTL